MPTISRATRIEFREYLVGAAVLREIADFFEAAGLRPGTSPEPVGGQRRSYVEDFYASVNWDSPRDTQRVLHAYELILLKLPEESDDLKKLVGYLERDGFAYENRRLVSRAPPALDSLIDGDGLVDRRVFGEHVRRIEAAIEQDPALAIGSAKELVEAAGKLILEQHGIDPREHDGTVLKLLKKAMSVLDLDAESIPDSKRGADSIRGTLRGLSQVVQGTAELRGLYGTGHGRNRPSGITPRHARLVVGAATTLVRFLVETNDERRRERCAVTERATASADSNGRA